jgi:UDP-N-acetyl-D-glucosamine dehydrogenase
LDDKEYSENHRWNDRSCTEIAALWYKKALDTIIPVSSPEVAEMAKLLENTFRMINIGLVNELALMCDRLNIDVWEVIDAAAKNLLVL